MNLLGIIAQRLPKATHKKMKYAMTVINPTHKNKPTPNTLVTNDQNSISFPPQNIFRISI